MLRPARAVFRCASGLSLLNALQHVSDDDFLDGAKHHDFTTLMGPDLERCTMNELVTLRQQISDMQKQAAELQKKNRPAVLAELREQMAAYDITAEELSRPAPKAQKPRQLVAKPVSPAKGKKLAVPLPAKYRGPEGQEWTGRVTAQKWLNELLVNGKTRGDFLINPNQAASSSAAAE